MQECNVKRECFLEEAPHLPQNLSFEGDEDRVVAIGLVVRKLYVTLEETFT